MDSIFSKLGLVFATLLASLSGPSYISLDKDELNLSWRMGDLSPIYSSVNLTNKGDQKMRFQFSSSAIWADMYREGQPGVKTFNVNSGAAVKVIIEAYPQGITDGAHSATITIKAVNDLDDIVAETVEFKVNLKKNYTEPTPTSASVTQTMAPKAPFESESPSPKVTFVGPPQKEPTPTASPTLKKSPSATPAKTSVSSPTYTPDSTPAVNKTKTPTPSVSPDQVQQEEEHKSLWDFIKGIFSWLGFGD